MFLSIISLFTILGSTLAYFTTTDRAATTFLSGKYQGNIVQDVSSPRSWLPGQTISKNVVVTNTGNVDMALRASIVETWYNADGEVISNELSNGEAVALLNLGSDWVLDSDGHYYYGTKSNLLKLEPNKKSSSFLKSVTFNPNTTASLASTVQSDGVTTTVTYKSSGKGYDNAKYNLHIVIDTIQYDQASNVW